MSKNKKVIRYKKPFNINIGVVIFVIIFIYLVFNVFTYMTTTHISVYEVQQGTMAENNIYKGLILREEQVYASGYTGSPNYYVRETSRVGANNLVYSVDENGDVSRKIAEASRDVSALNEESLKEMEEDISNFQTSYDSLSFYNVYAFKENMESSLNEALSLNALDHISDYAANAQNNNTFHLVNSERPGIVAYYTDGFESVNTENFTADMFDETAYKRTSSKRSQTLNAGDPAYKLITSEKWHIVVPISQKLADELLDGEVMQIRFLKDEKRMNATYRIIQKEEQYYLILELKSSMVRYAKERYVEIELLLKEETGLKIPNSAITEKEFYTIPVTYFMKGGDSDEDGILVERIGKDKKNVTEFITPTIYYETEEYFYIDSEQVTAGERILKTDSSASYIVGTDTASLKGVYNINKGYAVFKQINLLYENEEYAIVETGTPYGISLYDHIALDGSKINENDLIK